MEEMLVKEMLRKERRTSDAETAGLSRQQLTYFTAIAGQTCKSPIPQGCRECGLSTCRRRFSRMPDKFAGQGVASRQDWLSTRRRMWAPCVLLKP